MLRIDCFSWWRISAWIGPIRLGFGPTERGEVLPVELVGMGAGSELGSIDYSRLRVRPGVAAMGPVRRLGFEERGGGAVSPTDSEGRGQLASGCVALSHLPN